MRSLLAFLLASRAVLGASVVSEPRAEITQKLEALIPQNTFILSASEAAAIAKTLSLTPDELLVELIPLAKRHARPPISNYRVGEAGRGLSGVVYLGVNVEFPGQALHQTIHGEQFLIASALVAGEKGFEAMAMPAAPCGHCRQFMHEMGVSEKVRILFPGQKPFLLKDLLPFAFGPNDLGVKGALLAHESTKLGLVKPAPAKWKSLAEAALEAARHAYAPYAGAVGIALETKSGKIFAGGRIDNAAFNPSLPALQVALVGLVKEGLAWDTITRAALVEAKNASAKEFAEAKILLGTIAPKARWEKFVAE